MIRHIYTSNFVLYKDLDPQTFNEEYHNAAGDANLRTEVEHEQQESKDKSIHEPQDAIKPNLVLQAMHEYLTLDNIDLRACFSHNAELSAICDQ